MSLKRQFLSFFVLILLLWFIIEWEKNSFSFHKVVSIEISHGGESRSNEGSPVLAGESLDAEITGESKSQVASPYAQIIKRVSREYGIDWKIVYAICLVESNCDTSRVGDNDESYGAFQIHLPSHPEITKERATDFEWSLRWTIEYGLKYAEKPEVFFKNHNGLYKTTNDWYVNRCIDAYNSILL